MDAAAPREKVEPLGTLGVVVATWGVLGFVALLTRAILSLTPLALQPIRDGSLGALHLAVYAAWVAFSIWAEAYRGFQRRVSPRVVARALYLAHNPRPLHAILAPFFCMALFHATRRAQATAWGVFVMVVVLVVTVARVPQPWRGIIDGGVVVGLGWGAAATLWFFARGLAGHPMPVPNEIPVPLPGA